MCLVSENFCGTWQMALIEYKGSCALTIPSRDLALISGKTEHFAAYREHLLWHSGYVPSAHSLCSTAQHYPFRAIALCAATADASQSFPTDATCKPTSLTSKLSLQCFQLYSMLQQSISTPYILLQLWKLLVCSYGCNLVANIMLKQRLHGPDTCDSHIKRQ